MTWEIQKEISYLFKTAYWNIQGYKYIKTLCCLGFALNYPLKLSKATWQNLESCYQVIGIWDSFFCRMKKKKKKERNQWNVGKVDILYQNGPGRRTRCTFHN